MLENGQGGLRSSSICPGEGGGGGDTEVLRFERSPGSTTESGSYDG